MDRIERHDILNAAGLAAVLLVMAFLLSMFAGRLFDEGSKPVVDKTSTSESTTTSSTSSTSTTEPEVAVSTPEVHLPNTVTVVVANAARIGGIAGKGSAILKAVSYDVLGAADASTTSQSVVYYEDGYEGDAAEVAKLLQMAETAIAPMPASVAFDRRDAKLAVIIGEDTLLR